MSSTANWVVLEKIIQNAINKERRRELDLYKNYAQDPEFKRAFDFSIARLLAQNSRVVKQRLMDTNQPGTRTWMSS